MKKMNWIGLAAAFVLSSYAHAELLTLKPGTVNKGGVVISAGADAHVGGFDVPITTVGSGIRTKLGFNVYVAELMVETPEKFVKTADGALSSLKDEAVAAMRLNFVRDVSVDKVSTSFEEAFYKNKVDLDSAPIKAFIEAVKAGGDAKKGTTLTVVVTQNVDATETVYFEGPNGKIVPVNGPQGLIMQIFALWLGTPVDSGVAELKKQLLQ